ncbi:MAG: hypothetical protein Q8N34_03185 [Gammaproteobacteria bacterium]|nr:hypothetical protein [Gammaproteobacteria bacterium]
MTQLGTPTKKPSLTPVSTGNTGLDQFIRDVCEIHNVEEGLRGKGEKFKLDKKPSYRDLVKLGLVVPQSNASGLKYIGPPVDGFKPGNGSDPDSDYSRPPAPENVTAVGGFTSIFVAWDDPLASGAIPFFSHAEVYRSATDDLGTAVLTGTTIASFYADTVGSGQTFYYWVRFVKNVNGTVIYGPYNATAGTVASSADDIDYILETLEGAITETHLYSALQTRIDGIEDNAAAIEVVSEITDGLAAEYYVKTDVNGYVAGFGIYNEGPGASGFLVNADYFAVGKFGHDEQIPFIIGPVDGVTRIALNAATFIPDVTITNAKIHTVAAEKLFVNTGTIANAIIGSGHIVNAMIGNTIQSTVLNLGSGVGWIIDKSGTISAAGITIYDNSGNVILSSGGAFSSAIANSAQQWSQVSGTGKPADNATANIITYSSSSPSGGNNGDLWFLTTTGTLYTKVGGVWNKSSTTTFNQDSTPSDPSLGDFWYQPSTLTMFRRAASSWETVARAMATLSQITVSNASTYIQSLAVDTLQIANNAVTLPQYTTASGGTITTSWATAVSINVNWGSSVPGAIMVLGTVNCIAGGSGDESLAIRFRQGSTGAIGGNVAVSVESGFSTALTGTAGFVPSSSTETYYMEILKAGGASYTMGNKNLLTIGLRK